MTDASEIVVSVVVVNWNGLSALQRGLASLEISLERVDGASELIIVDNGSSDGSIEYIRGFHPRCVLVENRENVGFSPAANEGIRLSHGRFVALINNDVICHELWLRHLVNALEAEPAAGSAAAQLRYLHDPGRINSAGIDVDVFGRPRDRRDGMPAAAEPRQPVWVFGASGGAVLYRRELLADVGLLDDRFFAYLEDVDLAWRARRAGWRALYVPASVVLHEYSASSARTRGLKEFLSSRNMIWVLAKNASPSQLAIAVPAHLILSVWTAALAVVRKDSSALRGVAVGVWTVKPFLKERDHHHLPLRAFVIPRPLRYRIAARLRRREARRTVEPNISALSAQRR